MSPGQEFILFCLLLLVLLLLLLLRFVLVIGFWLLLLFEIGCLVSLTILTHWVARDDLELLVLLLLHFPGARIQMWATVLKCEIYFKCYPSISGWRTKDLALCLTVLSSFFFLYVKGGYRWEKWLGTLPCSKTGTSYFQTSKSFFEISTQNNETIG